VADHLSAERRSANMARIRGTNTRPELRIRKLLHALGYRYRCHLGNLPGKPDLVFTKRRKVVFVHGCFWHQHPGCKKATLPKSREAYWTGKLRGNIARDHRSCAELSELGWGVLTVWECELQRLDLADRLQSFLGPTRVT